MNKFIFAIPFLVACEYPEPMNPEPIYDSSEASVSGVEDASDAGQDVDIADVLTEAEPIKGPITAVPPKHQNILLIGDSEVMYSSWYFKPMRKPNETVYFDSKPGTTIGWWNGHFQREMSKYHDIDVVIVFLGTNNFNFNFLQPHENILATLKNSTAKCIWVGPTDVRMRGYKNLHLTGGLIKEAFEGICTYVDTESLNIPLADGVHPSQDGAVKWLTEIWNVKDSL